MISLKHLCHQQLAETRKLQVEDKEDEIKLLEQSVEQLECTVNVLENKVKLFLPYLLTPDFLYQ